jgi:opacity protein-like surface antigen
MFRYFVRAIAATALAAAAAGAQVADGNGFLIGTPNGSFTIRGGWALASAHSDVFAFTTQNLTLDRGDFSSPALDLDLAFRLRPHTDVVFSTAVAGTRKKSEFRDLVDNDLNAIEQHTSFVRIPMTVSLKQYLTNRGRAIGKLAWIPSRLTPYVGAGAGVMWYDFKQLGDFVDFQTMDVFNTILESKGWAPTGYAVAGNEISVSPRFAIVTEARYGWAKSGLSTDFSGFDRIDLSGFSTTAGIAVRF